MKDPAALGNQSVDKLFYFKLGLLSSRFSILSFVKTPKRGVDYVGVCNRVKAKCRGFTLIELLFVIAIIGIIGAIAVPAYVGHMERSKVLRAIGDIGKYSLDVSGYIGDNGTPPPSLDVFRYKIPLDPWGNPYQYLNIVAAGGVGKARKDRFLVPLNNDFDFYSMGKDGKTAPPLQSAFGRDDIIRADDGRYVGLAYAY